MGLGGYYGRRFKTSLPVSQTVNANDYGISAEFGLKVGSIGMSLIWMSSKMPLFEEKSAPSVRQGTGLFKLGFYF